MQRYLPSGLTLLVALLGIAISIAGFAAIRSVEDQAAKREFAGHAQEKIGYIREELHRILGTLSALGEVAATFDPLTRDNAVSIPLMPASWTPLGIEQAVWLPVLDGAKPSGEGQGDNASFDISPAIAAGFAFESLGRVLRQSTDRQRPHAAVEPVTTSMTGSTIRPLVLAVPILSASMADQPSETRRTIRGVVVARVNIETLMHGFRGRLGLNHLGFAMEVTADQFDGEPRLVANLAPDDPVHVASDTAAQLTLDDSMEIAGINFRMSVRQSADQQAHAYDGKWIVLAVGLAFTGLLSYLLESARRNKARTERLVAERTRELKEANDHLEQLVAKHRRAEGALRESETRLLKAQRVGQMGSWDWIAETNMLRWSSEAMRIFGFEDNVRERPVADWQKHLHPEDRARIDAELEAKRDRGVPFALSYRILRPDGAVRHIREQIEPVFDADGVLSGETGTIQNVTEQKRVEDAQRESEGRLRSFMENSPVEMIIQDLTGRYQMVNRGVERAWRMRADQIIGRTAADLTAQQSTLDIVNEMNRAVLTSGQAVTRDLHVEDWGTEWTHEVKFPIRDDIGNIVAIGGVAVDMTEQKRTEQALIVAKDQAEQASSAKSQFLANMSHELRTPLNAIIGFAEIISRQLFGPVGNAKYADYARDIHESGEHLLKIVNSILDSARIEAGRFELHEAPCNLEEILSSSLRMIGERSQQRNIALSSAITNGLPRLYADEKAIKQIAINLLSNAVKFTPDGGAIEIRAGYADDGGVEISVRDNGIGIAPRHLKTIFERFSQVDESYARAHGGTGLGLYISQKLAQLHGGAVKLHSQFGQGTTATLTLPPARWRRVEDSSQAIDSAA
jgi:PAS domain S-box-containing protein